MEHKDPTPKLANNIRLQQKEAKTISLHKVAVLHNNSDLHFTWKAETLILTLNHTYTMHGCIYRSSMSMG